MPSDLLDIPKLAIIHAIQENPTNLGCKSITHRDLQDWISATDSPTVAFGRIRTKSPIAGDPRSQVGSIYGHAGDRRSKAGFRRRTGYSSEPF